MHRDLSELECNPAQTRRAQQRACDRWMVEFNEVRPHDALGGKTPAEVYRNSERRSLVPVAPNYPSGWQVRRVSMNGSVSLDDDTVFVSSALAGQLIGLKQEGLLRWRARFFDVDLGTIEIVPLGSAISGGAKASLTREPRQPPSERQASLPVSPPVNANKCPSPYSQLSAMS